MTKKIRKFPCEIISCWWHSGESDGFGWELILDLPSCTSPPFDLLVGTRRVGTVR